MKERAVPAQAMRAKAIVSSLEAGNLDPQGVFEAFADLDALPAEVVRDAIGGWIGPEHSAAPKRLRLRTLDVVKDADILDLGPVAEEQLRLAGKSWDGQDLAPEERLDEEVEGSFGGTLERRVLANASERSELPVYDVLLFAGDAGVVFRAGTSTIVAHISYGRVEMKDAEARSAIEDALSEDVVLPFGAGVPDVAASPANDDEVDDEVETPRVTKKKPAAKKKAAAPKKKAAVEAAPKSGKAPASKKTPTTTKKVASAKKTTAKKTTAKKKAASKA